MSGVFHGVEAVVEVFVWDSESSRCVGPDIMLNDLSDFFSVCLLRILMPVLSVSIGTLAVDPETHISPRFLHPPVPLAHDCCDFGPTPAATVACPKPSWVLRNAWDP